MKQNEQLPQTAWTLLQASGEMPPPRSWALFLDVDGTLVELAETPDAIVVETGIGELLAALRDGLGGAVALASGRALKVLDRLFSPLELPAAGLHGLERRSADGTVRRSDPGASLAPARRELARFVASHPGALLEDKQATLALHYRRVESAESAARRLMDEVLATLGAAWRIQEGKMVLELKPRRPNKGTAVEDFMAEPPFHGRVPVFIGDDVTDEDGFAAVQQVGGAAVLIGQTSETLRSTNAQYGLGAVPDLHRWLEALRDALTGTGP